MFAEGKEEAGQSDSPRVENGEGAHASKAPHQRSITALFRKAAAANTKTTSSKAAAEDSKVQRKGVAAATAEAQQMPAAQQAKPQALEHGNMANKTGSASEAKAPPAVSPAGHPERTGSAAGNTDLPGQPMTESAQRRPRSGSQQLGSPMPVQSQPHADNVRQQAKVSRILEQASSPQEPSGSAAPRQTADVGAQQPRASNSEEAHAGLSEQAPHDGRAATSIARTAVGQKRLQGDPCIHEAQHASSAPSEQKQAGHQMHESSSGGGGGGAQAAGETAALSQNAVALSDGQTAGAPHAPPADASAAQHGLGSGAGRSTSPGIADAVEAPDASKAEHADQDSASQPQQEKHAGQVNEALPDVDVAEQRRIMRDIWLRQNISRGSPKHADKGHAGSVKRKLKQEGEPGHGGDSGPKQLRINAMFKAPAR